LSGAISRGYRGCFVSPRTGREEKSMEPGAGALRSLRCLLQRITVQELLHRSLGIGPDVDVVSVRRVNVGSLHDLLKIVR